MSLPQRQDMPWELYGISIALHIRRLISSGAIKIRAIGRSRFGDRSYRLVEEFTIGLLSHRIYYRLRQSLS